MIRLVAMMNIFILTVLKMEKSCLIHEYFHFKSFKDSKKSLLSLIGIRFMQNLMHPIPTVVYFYPFLLRTHASINYLGGARNILAVITCEK